MTIIIKDRQFKKRQLCSILVLSQVSLWLYESLDSKREDRIEKKFRAPMLSCTTIAQFKTDWHYMMQ